MILRTFLTTSSLLAMLLSGTAQELLLDSAFYDQGIAQTEDFDQDKRLYYRSYDDENRPLVVEVQQYLGGTQWENWRRREYTYNDDGELLTLLTSQWSVLNETWQPFKERSYLYDDEGNLLTRVVRTVAEPGSPLQNNQRWQYTYEGLGLETGMLFQRWEDGAWTNVSRQLWSYNGDDLPINQLRQRWSGSAWEDARRRMWTYEDGMLLGITEQFYDTGSEAWVNERRRGYVGSEQALWTQQLEQEWNPVTEAWVNISRELLAYNANLQLESFTLQYWEEEDWLNQYQTSRDSDGETVNIFSDRWDAKNDVWQDYARYQLRFNEQGRRILERGWQFWEADMGLWLNEVRTHRRRYFWSEGVVNTNELTPNTSCLWPNPYRSGQEIWCTNVAANGNITLELINSVGQVVHQQRIDGTGSFQIHTVAPAGWYVCRLRTQQKVLHLEPLVLIP